MTKKECAINKQSQWNGFMANLFDGGAVVRWGLLSGEAIFVENDFQYYIHEEQVQANIFRKNSNYIIQVYIKLFF
ncbi:MAG: hypothetical protein ACFHWX_07880 [Bacteroidota bacterium]